MSDNKEHVNVYHDNHFAFFIRYILFILIEAINGYKHMDIITELQYVRLNIRHLCSMKASG